MHFTIARALAGACTATTLICGSDRCGGGGGGDPGGDASTHGAAVNLYLTADFRVTAAGDTTVQTFTVGNLGEGATGGLVFTFATPAFVNVDRGQPLPDGCQYIYENPDRTVSEVLMCAIPALASGATRSLAIPLAISDKSPSITSWGQAMITTAPGSADTETDITNNIGNPSVNIGGGPSGAGETNLYLTESGAVISEATPGTTTLAVGNHGPIATSGEVTVNLTTPFYVNIDRHRSLPPECKFLLRDPRPNVPEIVQCTLPPGMGPNELRSLAIPFALVPGGPVGMTNGFAAVRVDDGSTDVDPDRADNVMLMGPLVLVPPLACLSGSPARPVARPMDSTRAAGVNIASSAPRSKGKEVKEVDLTVSAEWTTATAGGRTSQTFTVSNRGEDASGPVRLVLVTPVLVNVDREGSLPDDCHSLYRNPDFAIPEIFECVLPALKHGERLERRIPVVTSANAPAVLLYGKAIVLPAASSVDVEQRPSDNIASNAIAVHSSENPASCDSPNPVDLYIYSNTANLASGRPADEIFHIGNKGPFSTKGATRVVLTTMAYVNVDRARTLPSGCRLVYENANPGVPEIVECVVSDPLVPGEERTLAIPLALVPDAPSGLLFGTSLVQSNDPNADFEAALTDNIWGQGAVASKVPPRPK